MAETPAADSGAFSSPQCAYADESFRESRAGGYYVVAAAVFEQGGHDLAREVLDSLRGRRRSAGKLHWNEMDAAEQRAAVKQLAALEALHLVVVGGPVPHRRVRNGHERDVCAR
ncbi:hypothetical protein [Saccharomonospora iraqiensis]|uniref:hypothetical protein n=1 Tax=Saccharomonospora iraqiensis TaxID=52698 RepID=UPI00041E2ACC|nr:hypothetical protein [Saccharomonospora iraqiensis]